MTADDWQKESKAHEATLRFAFGVRQGFCCHALKLLPTKHTADRLELHDILEVVLQGIRDISQERDGHLREEADLKRELAETRSDKACTNRFLETAVQ
jgi:hypothetical protein